MGKHDKFLQGAYFAISAGLAFDLIILHQVFDHHHLYNHPSVNMVEMLLAAILMIIAAMIYKKEFKVGGR